jgi:erythromycin esterase-like protein
MADNVLRLFERRGLNRKALLWAHNFHVGFAYDDPSRGFTPTMGHYLRETLGDAYYALALEFDHGTYLARTLSQENGSLGDFAVRDVPSAPRGSLPWYLAQAAAGDSILDLRSSAKEPAVERWLQAPQTMHGIGWPQNDSISPYTTTALGNGYDGIAFVHSSSATTPTPNARTVVATRAGH